MDASLLTPELHSKLCKKVAQLTKVIYHLNTRNEDSEGRLQLLQDDYEAEIENLLQDASAKVAAASEEGGGKAAAAAIAEKVAALEKSYAAEKKKSLELPEVQQHARDAAAWIGARVTAGSAGGDHH